MARCSAISSGDCRRRVAATTANTRCLRRACAIAARAESSLVEEASIIIPRITTKPSSVSASDAMSALNKILSDGKLSGVYRPTQGPDEIARAAKAVKLSVVKLDLRKVRGKKGFLARLAKALHFPSYFGMNWDALTDCMRDLSWLNDNGWVVML